MESGWTRQILTFGEFNFYRPEGSELAKKSASSTLDEVNSELAKKSASYTFLRPEGSELAKKSASSTLDEVNSELAKKSPYSFANLTSR